jgi:hypothetical protein
MKNHEPTAESASSLSQKNRAHFRCQYDLGCYQAPSLNSIRNRLIRVDPIELDKAFMRWNKAYAEDDQSLAIDGKVRCNGFDASGHQTQIMSAEGHHTGIGYTQKK